MQSQATTVERYLAELPEDRRKILQAVRTVFLENLDGDYEEGMQYGMIGYYVPHRIYPAGYHCDPRQPLPFAGLASQKNHLSLYMMCVYGEGEMTEWFRDAWTKTGRKLDMGKACVRFKKLEDVALDVVAEAVRRMPAKKWIAAYEAVRKQPREGRKKPTGKASKKAVGSNAKSKPAHSKKSASKSGVAKPAKKSVKKKPS